MYDVYHQKLPKILRRRGEVGLNFGGNTRLVRTLRRLFGSIFSTLGDGRGLSWGGRIFRRLVGVAGYVQKEHPVRIKLQRNREAIGESSPAPAVAPFVAPFAGAAAMTSNYMVKLIVLYKDGSGGAKSLGAMAADRSGNNVYRKITSLRLGCSSCRES